MLVVVCCMLDVVCGLWLQIVVVVLYVVWRALFGVRVLSLSSCALSFVVC